MSSRLLYSFRNSWMASIGGRCASCAWSVRIWSCNCIAKGSQIDVRITRGLITPYFVIFFRLLEELPPKRNFGGLFGGFFQYAKVVRRSCGDMGNRGAGIMSYALCTAHCGIDKSERDKGLRILGSRVPWHAWLARTRSLCSPRRDG